jgi:hypothetical protein
MQPAYGNVMKIEYCSKTDEGNTREENEASDSANC